MKKRGSRKTLKTSFEGLFRTSKRMPSLHKLKDDWLVYFSDRCRLVSDQEMQGLWSRVLAGEANSPGAFSKRTLNFLPNLEKAEAESFTRLCGFVCVVEGNPQPLIHKVQDQIHKQQDLTFDSLKHLEAIGLIHFQGAPLAYSGVVPNGCVVSYYDKRVTLVMP